MSDTEEFNKILLQMKQRIYLYIYSRTPLMTYISLNLSTIFFRCVLQIK